jgi:hypothetical protein
MPQGYLQHCLATKDVHYGREKSFSSPPSLPNGCVCGACGKSFSLRELNGGIAGARFTREEIL